jgi:hypothetical protein
LLIQYYPHSQNVMPFKLATEYSPLRLHALPTGRHIVHVWKWLCVGSTKCVVLCLIVSNFATSGASLCWLTNTQCAQNCFLKVFNGKADSGYMHIYYCTWKDRRNISRHAALFSVAQCLLRVRKFPELGRLIRTNQLTCMYSLVISFALPCVVSVLNSKAAFLSPLISGHSALCSADPIFRAVVMRSSTLKLEEQGDKRQKGESE